jgi:hypothetical protein
MAVKANKSGLFRALPSAVHERAQTGTLYITWKDKRRWRGAAWRTPTPTRHEKDHLILFTRAPIRENELRKIARFQARLAA